MSWLKERWIADRTARSVPIATQFALARDYQVAGWHLEKGRPQAQRGPEAVDRYERWRVFTGFSRASVNFTSRYLELNGLEINRRLIGPRERNYGSRQIYCEVTACCIGTDQFQPAVMRFGNPQGYRESKSSSALAPPNATAPGVGPEESS